jgi:hypothetical protein
MQLRRGLLMMKVILSIALAKRLKISLISSFTPSEMKSENQESFLWAVSLKQKNTWAFAA